MSERTMEKARQVVHRLSEWYFAEGGDNDPDSPIDREDLDALHDLVRTAEATAEMERRQAGAYAAVAAVVRRELEAPGAGEDVREWVAREVFTLDAPWRREYWDQFRQSSPRQAQAYYDTADRILALLRTPRGGRSALWWAANELVAALDGRSTLTVQQCITGVKRLLAEADLRTPRGEGEAEALAAEILAELRRAREKFPGNNVMTLALVEEVGELAKATFEESRDRVRQEAIQVAVMAMRVVLDGDQTLDAWREAKGLDPLVVAARRGEGGGE